MRHRRSHLVGSFALLALAALPVDASDTPAGPTAIQFPPGASSSTVRGALAGGRPARYTVGARASQWLEVALGQDSVATVRLYGPGWRLAGDGSVAGDTELSLPRFGDAGSGAFLEQDGTYLLEVVPQGERADFRLELSIRAPRPENCGDLPQQPMNRCFAAVAAEAVTARARAYAKVEASLDANQRNLLTAAEKAWRGYAEAGCRFQSAGFEGGTLQPTVYWMCMARFAREREAELTRTPDGEQ